MEYKVIGRFDSIALELPACKHCLVLSAQQSKTRLCQCELACSHGRLVLNLFDLKKGGSGRDTLTGEGCLANIDHTPPDGSADFCRPSRAHFDQCLDGHRGIRNAYYAGGYGLRRRGCVTFCHIRRVLDFGQEQDNCCQHTQCQRNPEPSPFCRFPALSGFVCHCDLFPCHACRSVIRKYNSHMSERSFI